MEPSKVIDTNAGETFSEWLDFSHPPGVNENRKTVFIHPPWGE